MRDNPTEDKLDPAEDVRRRSKKNSPSVLSCIVKRTKEGVTVAAKSEQFTADNTGKGQFLRGNRRNLVGEGVVKDLVSKKSSECAQSLQWSRQWARNMGKGERRSGPGERVRQPIPGKFSMTGDPPKRKEREPERPQTFPIEGRLSCKTALLSFGSD